MNYRLKNRLILAAKLFALRLIPDFTSTENARPPWVLAIFIGQITIDMAVFIGKASFLWLFSYASIVGLLLYRELEPVSLLSRPTYGARSNKNGWSCSKTNHNLQTRTPDTATLPIGPRRPSSRPRFPHGQRLLLCEWRPQDRPAQTHG